MKGLGIAVAYAVGFCLIAKGGAVAAALDPTTVIVTGAKRDRPANGAAPPPVEDFTRDKRFELAAISREGNKAAFVVRYNDQQIQDGHKLLVYDADTDRVQDIKLDRTPYTGMYWIDQHLIALTRSASGRKGTCPDLDSDTGRRAEKLMNLLAVESAIQSLARPEDAGSFRSNLMPLKCMDYGIRQYSITATVNIDTGEVAFIGSRMSENRQLGTDTVKPVREGVATSLMGAFVDLNDKPGGGDFSEKLYLWKVDPVMGRGRIIDDNGGNTSRASAYVDDWLFDNAGEILARSYYDVLTQTYTIAGYQHGKWKPLLSSNVDAASETLSPFIAGLGRDGKSLLIVTADKTSNARYHYRELTDAGILSGPVDINGATRDIPIFASDDDRLVGFMTSGTQPKYSLFDPTMQKIYDAAMDFAPEDSVEVVSSAADDARKMILKVKGRYDSGQYYYVDFSKGTYRTIGTDYPDLKPEWIASETLYEYKSRDGLNLEAVLLLPSVGESGARPLLVMPHDGPRGHASLEYSWLAQLMASRGYVVLQPNYRGSDIYPETSHGTGRGEFAGKMLDDIEDGVKALENDHLVATNSACIAGAGYGGYAALMLASREGARYRCVVAIGSMVDLPEFKKSLHSERQLTSDPSVRPRLHPARTIEENPYDLTMYEPYWDGVELSGASPLNRPVPSSIPLLYLQPSADHTGNSDKGEAYVAKVISEGGDAKYRMLNGCDRNLSTEACKISVANEILDFINKAYH